MEYIICIILLITTLMLSKVIFKINIKKLKEFENNKELDNITNKFPENVKVATEILGMLGNQNVKVEQAKNTKTSLYIAIANKILIADMKSNYARIQTIAHECIHSCQERRLLILNFIISNVNILYFLVIIGLTLFKTIEANMLYVFILTFMLFLQYSARSFLEIDAMIKARYLAKEYIEMKRINYKRRRSSPFRRI